MELRLEYASLDAQVTENVWVCADCTDAMASLRGVANRYRVLGRCSRERLGRFLVQRTWARDQATRGRTELHGRVFYNGEGYGRAEETGTIASIAARRFVPSPRTA